MIMQSAKGKVYYDIHHKLFYQVEERVSDFVGGQVRNIAEIENIMVYGDVYMTMVEEYDSR